MEYSDKFEVNESMLDKINSIISNKKAINEIAMDNNYELSGEYGRLLTFGFVRDIDEYKTKLKYVDLKATPYVDNYGMALEYAQEISRKDYPHLDIMEDLFMWGISSFYELKTIPSIKAFVRIQQMFMDGYDAVVRGIWPCFEDKRAPVILYLDQDTLVR